MVIAIAACSGFPDVFEADRRGTLEVWNRTEEPVWIVGRDESFWVPACGHESQDDFLLNEYDVRDAEGRYFATLGGGRLLMFRTDLDYARGESYAISTPPPGPLPPCEGVIEGQPGTETAVP